MTVADQNIQGYDPRTGAPAGEPVPATDPAEVDRAVARALTAFPQWARFERAVALEAVADALDAHTDELAGLADRETALGLTRLTGEVARTTGQLRLFAEVLGNGGYRDTVVEPADGARPDLRRINRPTGPVAVFAASNFPFAFSVAGGDTASALAAGCPVIVKAHEAHPHTSLRTAELVKQALAGAGAPEGVFDLVFGFEAGCGWSSTRGSPGSDSPAPPAAASRWRGCAPSGPRPSRSTASSARSTRSSCSRAPSPPAVPSSRPATPARSPSAPASSAPTPD